MIFKLNANKQSFLNSSWNKSIRDKDVYFLYIFQLSQTFYISQLSQTFRASFQTREKYRFKIGIYRRPFSNSD